MFKVQGIDHIGLAVKDVQKSVKWYRELFGLERLFEDVWGNFPGVVGIGETIISPSAWTAPTSKKLMKPFGKKESSLSSRITRL